MASKDIKNGTSVVQCDCKHEFQDKNYGKSKRLANNTLKGYKCTVCGKIHIKKEQ